MTLKRAAVLLIALVAVIGGGPEALAQTYSVEQLIRPSSPTVGPFTSGVAIDGLTAAVASSEEPVNGARETGVVYIYVKSATSWVLQQRIEGQIPGKQFGWSLALSGDTLAVADFDGTFNNPVRSRVFVYVRAGSSWALQTQIATGYRPVIRLSGNSLLVGSQSAQPNAPTGSALVYERTGTTWSSGTTLPPTGVVPSDGFGSAGDISGDTICVGSSFPALSGGSVRVYVRSGSGWILQQALSARVPTSGDTFGYSCAVDGDTMIVGGRLTGPPQNVVNGGYVYVRSSGTWTLQQEIIGSNPNARQLGLSVALKGDVAILGADGFSVFRRNGATWAESQSVPQPSSYAENSVSLDGVNGRLMTSQYAESARIYSLSSTPIGAPGAPTSVRATVNGNNLSLSWGAPASGGAPTSYTLVARTTAGGPVLGTLPLGNVTSFGAVAPNGVFVVSLTATNAQGTGPESAAVTVTLPSATALPGTPTNLGAVVAGSTVTFTWTAPASGGPVANYVLVAGLTPGFAVPAGSLTLSAATTIAVPGIPPGTFYARVLAQNAGGTSAATNEVAFTVAGASAPSAPTLNVPTVTGNTVGLSWSPGGGGAPTSYVLTALTAGGVVLGSAPLSGASASFPGVPSGSYLLRLVAVNSVGPSPPSNTVTLVVP